MKSQKIIPYSIIPLFLLLLFGCSNEHQIKLIHTNASEEISLQENLRFEFNQDLVPDSLFNQWRDDQYITFAPEIPGKFKWESGSVLIFSPLAALPPATIFKGTIQDKLLAFQKNKRVTLPQVTFFTRNQELLGTDARWTLTESSKIKAEVTLHFRYPQDVKTLLPLLQITVDNKPALFHPVSTEPSQDITLSLSGGNPENKNYTIGLQIKKGIIPVGGSEKTNQDINAKISLSSPLILEIQGIETTHDGIQGVIKINTSQRIQSEEWEKSLRISPQITYRLNQTETGVEIISESFQSEQTYQVYLPRGLKGVLGGLLKEDFQQETGFGEPEPYIAFEQSESIYLSAKGLRNIKARITGVEKVKLTVAKIYENNLSAAMYHGYYGDDDSEEPEGAQLDVNYKMGDVVYETEFDVRSLPRSGDCRILHFDLKEKLPEYWGIYHVTLRSSSDYWRSDSRFISASDIGLIAKSGKDQLTIFTRSLKTANPIPNVIIQVYGRNNQIVGGGSTNKEGVLQISCRKQDISGFKPAMITARYGSDFNFLPFTNTHVERSRFDVGGKWISSTGLDAFLYSARDVYRPGEQVSLTAVVRDENWQITETAPLKIKVRMPNGSLLTEQRRALNDQGALSCLIDIPKTALTGSYTAQLFTSQDVLLQTLHFLVEEFMPDRIKVNTTPVRSNATAGEEMAISIEAMNLFGTPASDRKVEVEQQIHPQPFISDRFKKYSFKMSNTELYIESKLTETQTNKEGKAGVSFRIPDILRDKGLLECRYYTTVFDETGRPVNRLNIIPLHTQETYLGISTDGYRYYPVQQSIRFPLIAVNKLGTPKQAKARVQVIRNEYKNNLIRTYDSYYRYESSKKEVVVSDLIMDIQGENSQYVFTPAQPGEYVIRLYNQGAFSYVQEEFFCYGGSGFSGVEVNREGNIDISFDKSDYHPGETAKIFFKTPFNGKLIVTVETQNVLQSFSLETIQRTAELKLPLSKNYLPNIFISATLIKPHTESDIPLTVAHGFQSLSINNPITRIPLTIQSADVTRSKRKHSVRIKSIPGSQITLAAVDEGILQLTNFKTPDIHGHFYARRALQVQSYDLYPLLFPEVNPLNKSTGGDGFDLSKRINPVPAQRVKLAAFWSGVTNVNGEATATFDLDIPAFSGSLRLMAISWKNEKFGSCEKNLRVADPIIISTGAPRFLSPGDSTFLAVTITNTTSKSMPVSVSVNGEGTLKCPSGNHSSIILQAGSEKRLIIPITTLSVNGPGKVKVEVRSSEGSFTDITEIPVRSAVGWSVFSESGIIPGGVKREINLKNIPFLAGTTSQSIVFGSSPITGLTSVINDLIRYPHGCTEQQISAVFPAIYAGKIQELFPPESLTGHSNSFAKRVEETMRTIQSRQLQHGGIALWDGAEDDWYTSAYAAHFLTEATRAGYQPEPGVLGKIQDYLIARLRQKKYIPVKEENRTVQYIAREIPYSLFVLALGGKPQSGTMQYYKSNIGLLTSDCRYMLSAALARSGAAGQAKDILPSSFIPGKETENSRGGFSSPLRNLALSLYTLLFADPNNKAIPEMALSLQNELNKDHHHTTQENAFSFLALCKLYEKDQGLPDALIQSGEKTVLFKDKKNLSLREDEIKKDKVNIHNKGKGSLYYQWSIEGIPLQPVKEEDKGVRIRRTYFNRSGKEWGNTVFKQNDLVIVCLSLENSTGIPIEHLVISDLLPAGFEIENSRIQEISGLQWIKDAEKPQQTDIRDDRIHFFSQLSQTKKKFYYVVRCVTPGIYQRGAASVDAMYDKTIHSYHGSGKIRIE